jgi:hypothetical protein
MKTNWSISKKFRYRLFCITQFFNARVGFALPEEREEFYSEMIKNDPEMS